MFSLPDSIIHLIVDYIIPLIPEIRPECKCLSLHYFAYNPNMFFYIRHHGLDMKLVCSSMLSQQQHDDIVTFLVENPEYIDYDLFSRNPHPIAVQYILTHIDQYEAHWVYLSQNTNDDIVLYVLDHPNYINWNYLSANYNDSGMARTTPIGSYNENGYGLYDMAGNVSEWCWDWYGEFLNIAQNNPRGQVFGTERIQRGGGWENGQQKIQKFH